MLMKWNFLNFNTKSHKIQYRNNFSCEQIIIYYEISKFMHFEKHLTLAKKNLYWINETFTKRLCIDQWIYCAILGLSC